MSRPVAGDAIESRCVFVMRDISKPFEVDLISSSEDAWGVVVPIPAAPVAGKMFCACALIIPRTLNDISRKVFFIMWEFNDEKYLKWISRVNQHAAIS